MERRLQDYIHGTASPGLHPWDGVSRTTSMGRRIQDYIHGNGAFDFGSAFCSSKRL